ncbi:hypothetical protein Tco_0713615, partial [Tanacetum coccineum]
TSVTKTKAADYGHIKWIEDLVPNTMWSISHWGISHCAIAKQECWLTMTSMHSGVYHIGGEKDNNSMDLRLTENLLVMSTPNAESLQSPS